MRCGSRLESASSSICDSTAAMLPWRAVTRPLPCYLGSSLASQLAPAPARKQVGMLRAGAGEARAAVAGRQKLNLWCARRKRPSVVAPARKNDEHASVPCLPASLPPCVCACVLACVPASVPYTLVSRACLIDAAGPLDVWMHPKPGARSRASLLACVDQRMLSQASDGGSCARTAQAGWSLASSTGA